MQGLGTLFLLLAACVASRANLDIQVQENFSESRVRASSPSFVLNPKVIGVGDPVSMVYLRDSQNSPSDCYTSGQGPAVLESQHHLNGAKRPYQIYGKWFNLAVGSTCPWLRRIKDKMSVSTLVLQEGATEAEISMTSTRWRRGVCEEISGTYEKTDIKGKFLSRKPKWNIKMESYVVHTNYDEYAIFLTKKFSRHHGTTITAKLYGREPQLRDSLLQEFREVALSVGIPENSIVFMPDRGECVPGDLEPEPTPPLRARRAVLPQENEGSGAGPLVTEVLKKEDSCQLSYSEGPCLGLIERYYYNGASMACETFQYGGCLGNGNNFISEKECLQTCRTIAACNLPIVQGPCRANVELWAFDAAQGKCVQFTYGGCKGNGNKFYSEKECKEYCGVPGDGYEELMRS